MNDFDKETLDNDSVKLDLIKQKIILEDRIKNKKTSKKKNG